MSPPPGPWPRRDRIAFLLLVVGTLASLPFLVHPWFDPMPDASMYLVTARSLLAGEGYTMLGEPFHVRPPGMPALFVTLIAIFGESFQVLNFAVAAFGTALVLLLFLYYRPSLGGPLALLVGATLWLNPAFRTFSNQLLSDVPGAALILLSLILDRWARRGGKRRDVVLGLAIAAAAYVRTMAVLVIPAIWIARWLERRREPASSAVALMPTGTWVRRLGLFTGVAFLALLPWQLRQASIEPVAPANQTHVYSYGTGMFHEDVGDPASRRLSVGEIFERSLRRRFVQIAGTAGHRLDALNLDPGAICWSLVFLAALLWRLARRGEATELFALASIAVLSIYFGYQERLLLPVYVLLLPAAAELARSLAARVLPARGAEAAVGLGLVAVLAFDLDLHRDWGAIKKRHRDFTALADGVNRLFGPEKLLATGSGFHYQVYLERPVYSLSFSQRRGGRAAVEELLAAEGIDVVLLWRRFKQDRELQNWLPQNHKQTEIGPAIAVEVR